MSGANVSPIGRNKEEWLVQATDYRKLNEPPRPRLQRNGTIYLMARPPLLCQGGDFGFPSSCLQCPRVQQKMWDIARHHRKEGWLRHQENFAKPPKQMQPGGFSSWIHRKTTPVSLQRRRFVVQSPRWPRQQKAVYPSPSSLNVSESALLSRDLS